MRTRRRRSRCRGTSRPGRSPRRRGRRRALRRPLLARQARPAEHGVGRAALERLGGGEGGARPGHPAPVPRPGAGGVGDEDRRLEPGQPVAGQGDVGDAQALEADAGRVGTGRGERASGRERSVARRVLERVRARAARRVEGLPGGAVEVADDGEREPQRAAAGSAVGLVGVAQDRAVVPADEVVAEGEGRVCARRAAADLAGCHDDRLGDDGQEEGGQSEGEADGEEAPAC